MKIIKLRTHQFELVGNWNLQNLVFIYKLIIQRVNFTNVVEKNILDCSHNINPQ